MKRFVLSAAAATALAYGSPARAADDSAAAQALFYEARQLMKENKFGIACPKLEESLRLDYGIGTEFNLADCNEKIGKLATAWSGFISVASAARSAKQADREKVARDRAKALEPRLPKLTIEVPAGAPASMEVKRDGTVIGAAAWNTAVPVDPGTHKVTATATGKQPWESTVTLTEGKQAKVNVPKELPDAAVAAVAPPPITPPPNQEKQEKQEKQEPASTTTTTAMSFPEPIIESRGSTQRNVGWIVAGLGVASLGVGAGFGIHSYAKGQSSNDNCAGDLCNAEGLRDRNAAIRSGDVSTITTIAGAGALLGGVVLVLTAPKNPPKREAASIAKSIRPVPQVAINGAGLSLQGVLP
ncbi:MAG: hypothetical protein KIT84_26070 [Labilithrix sp.]|nr:hypothetical protein [Labilithrix sp.]MCW5814522.1 hypothetical protein [Labilithrix sp.]